MSLHVLERKDENGLRKAVIKLTRSGVIHNLDGAN